MATGMMEYGGILLVSLSLISASAIPDKLSLELLPHRNARAAAASCHLTDGRYIAHGANFTRAETGPCVTYRCSNGDVLPLEYNCLRDGKCYPLNDVYKLGCIERTCKLTGGRFEYVVSREACTGHDPNTCVDVGTTYKDGCFGYRCDKVQESAFSVSYHLRQADIGCELDGKCVPVNHTYTKRCRTMQCQQRFMAVGFFTIKNGCEMNGQCVDVNHTLEQDCRTFTCTEDTINGLKVYNIRPTKIRCKDAKGVCHEPGEWFPLLVDDKDPVNCTCAVSGSASFVVSLTCPEIGLGVGPGSPGVRTMQLPQN